MQKFFKKLLQPIEHNQTIRGVKVPDGLEFLQLIITGPPGAGKTYYIDQIRGWPNEGYIDLTINKWWKNQSLIYRPREVHLGLPFKGMKESITVFDKEWLEAASPLALDLERIKIPPDTSSFFSSDWKHKYVFEFMLPEPKTILKRRKDRHHEGYFPIDDDLSLEMVSNQTAIYREVALYLHRAGMQVYVREDIEKPPMRIVDANDKSMPAWLLPQDTRRGIIESSRSWKKLFFRKKAINWLSISAQQKEITSPCRLAHDGKSFELLLEKQPLHFRPEIPLGVKKRHIEKNWLIFSPLACSVKNIVGFARLRDGQSIVLGRENALYSTLFDFEKNIAKRHIQITNRHGDLILTPLQPGKKVTILRTDDLDIRGRIELHRYEAMQSIREIYGGPMQMLEPLPALQLLEKATQIIANDTYALKNSRNRAGGILNLPTTLTPIIVGDLHGQVDNLLKILTENYLLECLYANTVCLLILGDAVHSEVIGEMEQMESSIVMMDLILKLKIMFPGNVFYLRGNHDSFNPELSKNGESQGLLMKRQLHEMRGEVYVSAMNRLYDTLPYIAKSAYFCACHAAPPMTKVTYQDLLDIHERSELKKNITTKRVQRQYHLQGYKKKDVKRFRKVLDLPKGIPFIVGHTPLDPFGSYWRDVGGIKNHHIIYSGHQEGAEALLLDGSQVIPLEFPAEQVSKLISKIG